MLYLNNTDESLLRYALKDLCDIFTIVFSKVSEQEQEKIKAAINTIKNKIASARKEIKLDEMYFAINDEDRSAEEIFGSKLDAQTYSSEYKKYGTVIAYNARDYKIIVQKKKPDII